MSGKVAYGVVRDGLTGFYDAESDVSYPGTGSIWYNLANPARSATLIPNSLATGPFFDATTTYDNITFISSSAISADASQNRFSIPYYSLTTEPFAADIWYTTSNDLTEYEGTGSPNNYRTIIGCIPFALDTWFNPGSLNNAGWGIMCYGGNFLYNIRYTNTTGNSFGAIQTVLLSGVQANTTYNFFIHRNNITNKIQIYVNGSRLVNISVDNTDTFNNLNSSTLVPQSWQFGSRFCVGKYHNIKLYRNRNFTEQEIIENYLFYRKLFGL